MRRPIRVLLISGATIAIAALAAACGTQQISVPKSDSTFHGAVLFSQRCSGCHTLSYAATNGSASNVKTKEITNGPNFNVRCERPVTRIIYAIENGGFSGAIMPQNIVVGTDAQQVAEFVAKYAGRQAVNAPGVASCDSQPIGALPPAPSPTATIAAPAAGAGTTAAAGSAAAGSAVAAGSAAKAAKKHHATGAKTHPAKSAKKAPPKKHK